jgi:hypothetical protein
MTESNLGDGRVISGSRASRTAAMTDAAITRVDAKRSLIRRSSSCAFARLISPMEPPTEPAFSRASWTFCPEKSPAAGIGASRRKGGQLAIIHDAGIVSTGAGTFSPHPLHATRKSHKRDGGSPNMKTIIGEYMEKISTVARSMDRGTSRRGVHTCVSLSGVNPCRHLRSRHYANADRLKFQ